MVAPDIEQAHGPPRLVVPAALGVLLAKLDQLLEAKLLPAAAAPLSAPRRHRTATQRTLITACFPLSAPPVTGAHRWEGSRERTPLPAPLLTGTHRWALSAFQ